MKRIISVIAIFLVVMIIVPLLSITISDIYVRSGKITIDEMVSRLIALGYAIAAPGELFQGPTGRSSTLIVAASDASEASQAQADYLCDGIADDEEINTAIAALPARGEKVKLTEGIFSIINDITLPDNIWIQGNGDSTLLQAAGAGADPILINSDIIDGNSNVIVSDLRLDGNSFTGTYCLHFVKVTNALISNVIAENGVTGSFLIQASCTDIRIENCFGEGGLEDAYQVTGQCERVKLTNCNAYGGAGGFEVDDESYYCQLVNCISEDAAGDAAFDIHNHPTIQPTKHIQLTNCHAINPTGSGFLIWSMTEDPETYPPMDDIELTNCTAISPGKYGIHIYFSHNVKASNIHITEPTDYGVYITGPSENTKLENVTVLDGSSYGICDNGDSTSPSTIVGCTVEGCASIGFRLNGPCTVSECVSKGNLRGYSVGGSNVVLTDSKTYMNLEAAIEVDADNTIIDSNSCINDGATGDPGGYWGIALNADNCTVSNNRVDSTYWSYSCIHVKGGHGGNLIEGNTLYHAASSIFLEGTGGNQVLDNHIREAGYYGIRVESAGNYLRNNHIENPFTAYLNIGNSANEWDLAIHSKQLDLSSGAVDYATFHATAPSQLCGYTIHYPEASSGDAGVSIRIGKYSATLALDDDYYDITTSEINKAMGYSVLIPFTALTNTTIAAGETVTMGTAGGKAGTGEVIVILKIAEMQG